MKKLHPKSDEILGNSIKQITHQGGKEGKKKKKDPSPNQKNKTKNGSQKGPKTNHVPKPPTITISLLERKKIENSK
jgi:hypothetical protein